MLFRQIFILVVFSTIIVSSELSAQNYFQWRGIDRTGAYPSEGLLKEWPDKGPELLLLVDELGDSYSSVVLKDELMYTTGRKDEVELLTAIDMSGQIKWSVPYGESFDGTFKNARTTPTIVGDSAFLISGSGDLACVDIKKGRLIWSMDGYEVFEGSHGTWGTAESPLIIEDKFIYTPAGNVTTMVAVDVHNGDVIWKSIGLDERSAYCSPVLMKWNGLETIVTVTANYVIGVNPEDGELRWKFDYTGVDSPKSGGDINPVSPLIRENEIFVSSGYNHVGIMLVVSADQKSVTVKWKTDELDNHHGGVLFYAGYIYGSNFTNVVGGDWLCVDWENGELQYAGDFHGKGSIILSDGMLYCYDERGGNVALVNPNPEKFDIASSFKVGHGKGPHWSHPSIYDGKLFVRHGKTLGVYKIGN